MTGGLRAAGVPSSVTAMAGLVENPNPMVTSTAHGSPRSSPQPGRAGLSQPDLFSHLPPSQRKAAQNRAALAQRSAQPPEDVKLEERLRDLQSSPRQGRKEVGASDSSYAGSPSPRRSPQPPRQPSAFAHLPPSQRVAAESRAARAERAAQSSEDLQLQQRLRNLRSQPAPVASATGKGGPSNGQSGPTEDGSNDGGNSLAHDDIEGRLARLIGVSKDALMAPQQPPPPAVSQKKTAFEETEDLIKQAEEEARLEAKIALGDAELHARLDRLRSSDGASGKTDDNVESGEGIGAADRPTATVKSGDDTLHDEAA